MALSVVEEEPTVQDEFEIAFYIQNYLVYLARI